MVAAGNKADGVAKLLIEAKADLDAKDEVRPVGRCICLSAWQLVRGQEGRPGRLHQRRMHACAEVQ